MVWFSRHGNYIFLRGRAREFPFPVKVEKRSDRILTHKKLVNEAPRSVGFNGVLISSEIPGAVPAFAIDIDGSVEQFGDPHRIGADRAFGLPADACRTTCVIVIKGEAITDAQTATLAALRAAFGLVGFNIPDAKWVYTKAAQVAKKIVKKHKDELPVPESLRAAIKKS